MASVEFPSPIGGAALPEDFAPSVLFAVLYGLLVPLVVYRLYDRRSRTTLLIGTIIFAVERIAIFALRANQARNEKKRLSGGMANYMQLSFGSGYITIASDLISLLRCLLINASYGYERYPESSAAATKGCHIPPPQEGDPDYPRQRFWARRFTGFAGFAFLAATVPGIIAHSTYKKGFTSERHAQRTFVYRYVSAAVGLFLMNAVILLVAAWSWWKQPRVAKRGLLMLCVIATLTGTVAVYRMAVMNNYTVALDSTAPGSQNSKGSKVAFYMLHVAPEWLANAILLCINVRKIFGTGFSGDWRWRDETPKEKEAREKRAAKRAARRREREEKDGGEQIQLVTRNLI
ncbi:hypothetical protein CC1G_03315 [Coprinopsis cinerea okayama7|uniref:Integral membrane protein n=1 Tax=Coprinopsis cinerea (strain Okayama-7 / 130 / ATCC MYA-4618 / FGSC 9003) TaxID=240176 RepID=A8N7H2_COPC7|nr:hypothetical protein CC1G_03315 [Coprinopsis cinerea okayama7\|eukprot:XP_001830778.2 hypothetical protein CC1G_03315 [Coprinopsis cinerea okayama7\